MSDIPAIEYLKREGLDRFMDFGASVAGVIAPVPRKVVGVVGYGRLGRLVAGYVRAFGATVIAADPRGADDGTEVVTLVELERRADIGTVHVDLTDETRGLIGAPELAQMKDGAVLINTSRGELVDEGALLASLSSGRLAGAALDVLTDENADGMGTVRWSVTRATTANC